MILYKTRIKTKNLEVTDLKTTWYDMQKFYLKDLNDIFLALPKRKNKR